MKRIADWRAITNRSRCFPDAHGSLLRLVCRKTLAVDWVAERSLRCAFVETSHLEIAEVARLARPDTTPSAAESARFGRGHATVLNILQC
jgi:hypothetical protein